MKDVTNDLRRSLGHHRPELQRIVQRQPMLTSAQIEHIGKTIVKTSVKTTLIGVAIHAAVTVAFAATLALGIWAAVKLIP